MSTLATPSPAGVASSGFSITMLDGGLGAIPGSPRTGVTPKVDALCWCGCVVCVLPPVPPATRPEEA